MKLIITMQCKFFNSKKNHLYTLILLHGMNMNITTLFKTVKKLQKYNENLKIILPIAKKIDINWPDGIENNISSWYNYYTRYDNLFMHDSINLNDFNNYTKNIYKLLDNEINLIKNPKNLVIGGISQGGTLAFNIGINYHYKIGGIIGIHTIFMDNIIKFKKSYNKLPIFLFSGRNDYIYNIKFQNYSLETLREKYFKIFWIIEKNLEHCSYSKNEIKFLKYSLNEIFKSY